MQVVRGNMQGRSAKGVTRIMASQHDGPKCTPALLVGAEGYSSGQELKKSYEYATVSVPAWVQGSTSCIFPYPDNGISLFAKVFCDAHLSSMECP
eukprot:scaffold46170_cov18-Tisochrysis_lutea.AAC.4